MESCGCFHFDSSSIEIISGQMDSICKFYIYDSKRREGRGFFCRIPYNKKILLVLITNNHIINKKYIYEKGRIELNINAHLFYIKLDYDERRIYSSEKYDVTIIEIKECDGIHLHHY